MDIGYLFIFVTIFHFCLSQFSRLQSEQNNNLTVLFTEVVFVRYLTY